MRSWRVTSRTTTASTWERIGIAFISSSAGRIGHRLRCSTSSRSVAKRLAMKTLAMARRAASTSARELRCKGSHLSERILPPPPSGPRAAKPSLESDFWAGLFLDLTLRIEWLEQAIEAVPKDDASAESLVRLRGYSRAVAELHAALERVQKDRAIPELKPLFDLVLSLIHI